MHIIRQKKGVIPLIVAEHEVNGTEPLAEINEQVAMVLLAIRGLRESEERAKAVSYTTKLLEGEIILGEFWRLVGTDAPEFSDSVDTEAIKCVNKDGALRAQALAELAQLKL